MREKGRWSQQRTKQNEGDMGDGENGENVQN
jgi:hypothetical protein